MPRCRICNSKIESKSSVCPICGCPDPFDTKPHVTDLTIDVSKVKDSLEFHYKSKKKAGLLTIFLDIFGVGLFYLGYKKLGVFSVILNILLLVGSYFLGPVIHVSSLWMVIIALVLIILINLIRGLFILYGESKDASGEYLE